MAASELNRAYGTLAGLGLIGAALLAVPSTLLLDPPPPGSSYLLTLAGVVTGLLCLALPWERIDPRWLHAVGVAATVEAAIAVAVFGPAYVAFFFVIAVAVAYVSPQPRVVAAHLLLIGLALLGPVAWGPESPRSSLQLAFVVWPNLLLTAGVFAYLRMRLVADRRSYRRFAEETLALATRIAGYSVASSRSREGDSKALAFSQRFRVPARLSMALAALLAVPLLAAGAAAAGVMLPGFAADAFDRVGVELPHQAPAAKGPATPPAAETAKRGGAGSSAGRGGSGKERGQARDPGRDERRDSKQERAGGGSPPAAAPESATGASAPAAPPATAPPPATGAKPVGDALEAGTGTIKAGLEQVTRGLNLP